MSFTTDVKTELLSLDFAQECCYHAFSYGMLLFAGSFSRSSMYIKTENAQTAGKYNEIVKSICGCGCSISQSGGSVITVSVDDENNRLAVLKRFGLSGSEIAMRINYGNIECPDCTNAFIAGAFCACGSVSDPVKEYHLEFCVSSKMLCADLLSLLREVDMDIDIKPKEIARKYSNVIYIKESGRIADLVMYMGAINSGFEIMNTIVEKNIRNKANRISNCDTANLDKTIKAGVAQSEAVKKIISVGGITAIPEELRALALLRMDNPDMTLKELTECLEEPISRSGVNHRLKKLERMAKEL